MVDWRGQPRFCGIPAWVGDNIFRVVRGGRWGALLLRREGKPERLRQRVVGFILEIFASAAIFVSCQSMNFIAENAGRTAKFSSAHAIGKARSARNAVPRRSRKSFLPSPQRTRAQAQLRKKAAAVAAQAADAIKN